MNKRSCFILIFVFALIILDQLLKFWVKTTMFLGQDINLLGDWFKLHFVENEGMAFGLSLGGVWGKLLLTAFRLLASAAIAYLLVLMVKRKVSMGLLICTSLVFAGAVGNIIDGIFYGKIFSESYYFGSVATFLPEAGGYAPWLQGRVVDMFQFDLFLIPKWVPIFGSMTFFPAVFNLADTWITSGLLVGLLFFYKPLSEFVRSLEKKQTDTKESDTIA